MITTTYQECLHVGVYRRNPEQMAEDGTLIKTNALAIRCGHCKHVWDIDPREGEDKYTMDATLLPKLAQCPQCGTWGGLAGMVSLAEDIAPEPEPVKIVYRASDPLPATLTLPEHQNASRRPSRRKSKAQKLQSQT